MSSKKKGSITKEGENQEQQAKESVQASVETQDQTPIQEQPNPNEQAQGTEDITREVQPDQEPSSQITESSAENQHPTEEPVKKPIPLTMAALKKEIDELRALITAQSEQIAILIAGSAPKRKPVASNGKVQIQDTQTGKVYPSKNNAYQSLLKEGSLKDLVEKGTFGADPAKNSFGWYALNRAFPDRFKEIKEEAPNEVAETGHTPNENPTLTGQEA